MFSFLKGETAQSRNSWHLAFAISHFFNISPANLMSDWRKMSYEEKCEMKTLLEKEGYKIANIVDETHPQEVIEGSAVRIPETTYSNLPVPYGGSALMKLLPPADKVGPNYQKDDEPEAPRIVVDSGYRLGEVHPAARAV